MRVGRIALVVFLGLFLVFGVGGGCMIYSAYGTAIRLDESVNKSWADVETAVKRRFDLIPNFVNTVKAEAKYEGDTLQKVVEARSKALQTSGPKDTALALGSVNASLEGAIKLVNERYPELRATDAYRDLLTELEGSENRIAEMRKRYNESVRALNTHVRGPISGVASRMAGVDAAEYFQAGEAAQEAPKVDFTDR
jgi:LemA protein